MDNIEAALEAANDKLNVLISLLLRNTGTNLRYQSLQIAVQMAAVEPSGKKKNQLVEKATQLYIEYKEAAEETDNFIHQVLQLFESKDESEPPS